MKDNTEQQIDAMGIDQFCVRHGISRPTFYKLLNAGNAPKIMKVGARTLISAESAAEWRRRMERAA